MSTTELKAPRKRGFFVSLFLIGNVVSIPPAAFLSIYALSIDFDPGVPISLVVVWLCLLCIQLPLAIEVWNWSKMAVYAFFVNLVLLSTGYSVALLLMDAGLTAVVPRLVGLVAALIVLVLIRSKWSQFNGDSEVEPQLAA